MEEGMDGWRESGDNREDWVDGLLGDEKRLRNGGPLVT